MALPFPSLTFATPSSSSSGLNTSQAPVFNVGSGSAGGISWTMLAVIAAVAYFVIKRSK